MLSMHAADRPEPCSIDMQSLRAESDKADMDVESFSDGYLGGVVIDEGGIAAVGASGWSFNVALTCEHVFICALSSLGAACPVSGWRPFVRMANADSTLAYALCSCCASQSIPVSLY